MRCPICGRDHGIFWTQQQIENQLRISQEAEQRRRIYVSRPWTEGWRSPASEWAWREPSGIKIR